MIEPSIGDSVCPLSNSFAIYYFLCKNGTAVRFILSPIVLQINKLAEKRMRWFHCSVDWRRIGNIRYKVAKEGSFSSIKLSCKITISVFFFGMDMVNKQLDAVWFAF